MNGPNPCQQCGACCAHFRVSFYWSEASDATPGGVPAALTERLDHHRRFMRGTAGPEPRCLALEGEIGIQVRCAVYAARPSVCHEFQPAWANGTPNRRCDAARLTKGLAPLTPDSYQDPGLVPRAA